MDNHFQFIAGQNFLEYFVWYCNLSQFCLDELYHALHHSDSHLVITIPMLAPIAKKAAEKCPNLKVIDVITVYYTEKKKTCRLASNSN